MAGAVNPDDHLTDYRGLGSIFEFINGDGRWHQFNCGQAAACTYLTHLGKLTPTADKASAVMREIERRHPPDNFGGWLGTSRRCVERICRSFGVRLDEAAGEDELVCHLSEGRPAIVMLGLAGPKFWRWTLPAGHWMVAYGFDCEFVYLTNYGRMTWNQFRGGWRALVPRLIRMNGRSLVLWDER